MTPRPKVDVAGASAGAAAADAAGEFIENLYSEAADAGAPAEADPAAGGDAGSGAPQPGDEGFLGGFQAIQDEPPPEPAAPLPIKGDEAVPDHVVRKGEEAIRTWKQLRAELESERQKVADVERDRLL